MTTSLTTLSKKSNNNRSAGFIQIPALLLLGTTMRITIQTRLLRSLIACAYILRPHPGTENHARERGIPRTVGMQYRRAFQSVREALCGNGIPVWFCLTWDLLGLDSSLLTSISSGALFQARNNCVRKRKKPSSLKQENGLESGADSQRPFSKQKSRDSWGFRAPKIPADSHMIIF